MRPNVSEILARLKKTGYRVQNLETRQACDALTYLGRARVKSNVVGSLMRLVSSRLHRGENGHTVVSLLEACITYRKEDRWVFKEEILRAKQKIASLGSSATYDTISASYSFMHATALKMHNSTHKQFINKLLDILTEPDSVGFMSRDHPTLARVVSGMANLTDSTENNTRYEWFIDKMLPSTLQFRGTLKPLEGSLIVHGFAKISVKGADSWDFLSKRVVIRSKSPVIHNLTRYAWGFSECMVASTAIFREIDRTLHGMSVIDMTPRGLATIYTCYSRVSYVPFHDRLTVALTNGEWLNNAAMQDVLLLLKSAEKIGVLTEQAFASVGSFAMRNISENNVLKKQPVTTIEQTDDFLLNLPTLRPVGTGYEYSDIHTAADDPVEPSISWRMDGLIQNANNIQPTPTVKPLNTPSRASPISDSLQSSVTRKPLWYPLSLPSKKGSKPSIPAPIRDDKLADDVGITDSTILTQNQSFEGGLASWDAVGTQSLIEILEDGDDKGKINKKKKRIELTWEITRPSHQKKVVEKKWDEGLETVKNVAQLVYAFGATKFDGSYVLKHVAGRVLSEVDAFSPKELTMVATGFAEQSVYSEILVEAVKRQCTAATLRQLAAFTRSFFKWGVPLSELPVATTPPPIERSELYQTILDFSHCRFIPDFLPSAIMEFIGTLNRGFTDFSAKEQAVVITLLKSASCVAEMAQLVESSDLHASVPNTVLDLVARQHFHLGKKPL